MRLFQEFVHGVEVLSSGSAARTDQEVIALLPVDRPPTAPGGRRGGYVCGLCDEEGLQRMKGHDPDVGYWFFFCPMCGASWVWQVWRTCWLLMQDCVPDVPPVCTG